MKIHNENRLVVQLLTTNFVLGIIIVVGLMSCGQDTKYDRGVREAFVNREIPYIKENWKLDISVVLAFEKEKDEKNAEQMDSLWGKKSDPTHSPDRLGGALDKAFGLDPNRSEEDPRWKFWEEVAKEPEKYVISISKQKDTVFTYEILHYEEDPLCYSAMVSFLFLKDSRAAHFRIFFINTPEGTSWETVRYEFGWPHLVNAGLNRRRKG